MRLWTTLSYDDGLAEVPTERVTIAYQDGFRCGTLLKRTLAIGRMRIKFEISFIRHNH